MSVPISEHQVIKAPDGSPLYALVPWDEYRAVFGDGGDEVVIPLEVSKLANLGGKSLARAWREHLGLTQEEVARRMGLSRAAFAQMEAPDARPRVATLKKIAAALGVAWEQIKP